MMPVIEALAEDGRADLDRHLSRRDGAAGGRGRRAHRQRRLGPAARRPAIAAVAAETGAGLVVMHTGREREKEARRHRRPAVLSWRARWRSRGPPASRTTALVLDPGFGFAKETAEENFDADGAFRGTA